MRRTVVTALSGLALALAGGLPGTPLWADEAADQAAIAAIWDEYETARVAVDYARWLALWDAGGIKMSQGKPSIPYEMFAELVAPGFVPGDTDAMDIVSEEIVVFGDWAFSMGTYSVDWTEDGVPGHMDGKFLTILKRQPDGAWKIYRDHASANTK